MQIAWSYFKSIINLKYKFISFDLGDAYFLLFKDLELNCIILKDSGADQTEYEATYLVKANKPPDPDTDAYANTDDFKAACLGFSGTATKNSTTNIDYTLTEDRYIVGCEMVLNNQVFGDTCKLQIVHPTYGVVDEFATNWNIKSDCDGQGAFEFPLRGKLSSGLKVRVNYTSVGIIVNVSVGCNLILHRKP